MDEIIKHLKRNASTVIVAPSSIHPVILKKISAFDGLFSFTLMSESDFLNVIQPQFSEAALFHLNQAFNMTFQNASEILSIFKNVQDKNQLVDELKPMFLFLEEKGCISYKPWKDQPIKASLLVVGYPVIHPSVMELGKTLYQSFEIIQPAFSNHTVPLYGFIKESDEVKALAESIRQKLNDKLLLDQIKVHSPSASYDDLIHVYFKRYQIPYTLSKPTSFLETPRAQKIINLLNQDASIESVYDQVFERLSETNYSDNDVKIASKVLRILERPFLEDAYFKHIDYIKHQFSNIKVPKSTVLNSVSVGDFSVSFEEDTVIYILGFNEGLMPKPSLNNRYIDDKSLFQMGLETAKERTQKNTTEAKAFIHNPAVVWVSYSTKSLTSEKIVSSLNHPLTTSLKLKKETYHFDQPVHYSIDQDLFELKKHQASYERYGWVQKDLYPLYHSLKKVTQIPEKNTHKESLLSLEVLEKQLQKNPNLSYSKIEDYFKCQFRFLVKHLLKVDEPFKARLPLLIGNLYHYALSEIDVLPESLEGRMDYYQDIITRLEKNETIPFSNEETFYLHQLLEDVERFIVFVKTQHETSLFKPFAYEKKYSASLNGKTLNKMVGIVDKIMSYHDQFIIMDYKSSARTISFRDYEYGLNSQLPFYMGVVQKQTEELSQASGFFYQSFDPKTPNYDKNQSLQDAYEDRFKLSGYLTEANLSSIDPNYQETSFIKGVKTKKDGSLYKNTPVLSQEELDLLIRWIEDKVSEAVDLIESGSFKINPKGSISDTPSCKYCEYQAICYKKPEDYVAFNVEDQETFFDHVRDVYDS